MVSGSGVVISPDGELLTNHHVVDKATEIRCQLSDGSAYTAKVLGSDKDLDVCRRFVDSAAALGAKSAMLLPAPCPSDVAREEARDILAGYLSKLCDYSEGCGVTLSVENFSRISCPFSKADDLVYLLSSVPKLMMTFDTGNFIWVNESPSEAIDKILAIRKQPFSHVHMKNYSRERYNEYNYTFLILLGKCNFNSFKHRIREFFYIIKVINRDFFVFVFFEN